MRHPFEQSPSFVPMTLESAADFDELLHRELREDIGSGDLTTEAVIPEGAVATADVVIRARGVLAGLAVAMRAVALLDPHVVIEPRIADGSRVAAGAAVARIRGAARAILTAERVALNFLGRLCGIATLTRAYVDAAAGSAARIADTRKTTPGLRALERYAVRAGGGVNHRAGLYDAVLIKDNHIAAVGSIAEAIERARAASPPGTLIEAECDTLDQVRAALTARADSILLDNMDIGSMAEAVRLIHGAAIVEASGGVNLSNVGAVAATGVDLISVGALTHGATSLDVGLDFVLG
ncbi:MAG TPA: carboxylating nicotinate-nucleotide diphosphorylase [Candidatus Eremiobacteraceae bacterium]|nr:carboxylating nicotinate-nucleotide diphosphorylase [Candidatus Eremiobacteraceae bacterium]